MPGLFHRAIDIALIVLGGFGALHLHATGPAHLHEIELSLVAFVSALALSVFPACGTYGVERTRSVVGMAGRTAVAWLVVQMGGLALLYVIHRTQLLSLPWFTYWTLATGVSLLLSHTLTYVILRVVWPALQRSWTAYAAVQPLTPTLVARRFVKRGFDLTLGSVLIVALSPLLIGLWIAVRRDGGPALYGHLRVGRNGQKFRCLKFRSMVVNADQVLRHLLETDPQARAEWERDFKLRNDLRITPIGHFLRRTSLDELPQLWNVVRGDMSLVGPRPVIDQELERYGDDVDYYLMTKPGMTGLWQVSGRSNTDYATRVSLDVAYAKGWSLSRDIAILFKTFKVVVQGSGAY
ncbi:MAG TPA: sugar transferase [Paraburkholderia sp.]|jgi:lipopolysaccharide/colanic/teichoic acid biosynthesis glycosyltransferase|nr:sugar transferase [Paraburkholderia sp.]